MSNAQLGNLETRTDCELPKLTRDEIAEVKPTASTNVSPYKRAWQTSLMATFQSALLLQNRVEVFREDPFVSYRGSHTRAKEHESNALRGPTAPLLTPDHVRFGPYWYTRWYVLCTRSPAGHLAGQHREGCLQPAGGDPRPARERHVRRKLLWAAGQAWSLGEPRPWKALRVQAGGDSMRPPRVPPPGFALSGGVPVGNDAREPRLPCQENVKGPAPVISNRFGGEAH